jgi:hypothetical protein
VPTAFLEHGKNRACIATMDPTTSPLLRRDGSIGSSRSAARKNARTSRS